MVLRMRMFVRGFHVMRFMMNFVMQFVMHFVMGLAD